MISITYAREIDRIEHISMAERNRVAGIVLQYNLHLSYDRIC